MTKDDEDKPMAWKIRFKNGKNEERVVYSSLPTREDVENLAKLIEDLIWSKNAASLPPRMYQLLHPLYQLVPWDPDMSDSDNDRAVSLEVAIMWALGRG